MTDGDITAVAERVHRGLAADLDDVDRQYGAFLAQIQDRVAVVYQPPPPRHHLAAGRLTEVVTGTARGRVPGGGTV